jgi:tetratricopeptide (TPR) repeat protein
VSSSKPKRAGGGTSGGARVFFDRFREAVAGYAEGVHRLGAPAPAELLAKVADAELRDFFASWNGAELFIDAYTIFAAGGAGAGDASEKVTWFGETSLGDRLGLADGCVVRLEEDTGELLVEGTSFARWLDATVVADGVLYDSEGEWLDDVFDDEGELAPAASIKREKKALKIDPGAPAPAWRLAKAQERSGDSNAARKTLETLVAEVRDFAWAWFDLGRLRHGAGETDAAEAAFAAAADAGAAQGSELAGWFAAHAARMAAERRDEAARARHAERALALDPDVARAQRRAAAARFDEGGVDEARELAALAAALLPRDLEVAELSRRIAAAKRSEVKPGAERSNVKPGAGRSNVKPGAKATGAKVGKK